MFKRGIFLVHLILVVLFSTIVFSAASIVEFTPNNVQAISAAPLSQTSFVLFWIDAYRNDASYGVYHTDGVEIYHPGTEGADVDTDIGGPGRRSCGAAGLDANNFVLAFTDTNSGGLAYFTVRNTSGSTITSNTLIDSSISSPTAILVSAFDNESFVVVWTKNAVNDQVLARSYWSNGTAISDEITIDSDAGDQGGAPDVSVSAFDDESFVIGWVDDQSNTKDTVAATYYKNGTVIQSQFVIDSDSGGITATDVSAFNSTAYVIQWYDNQADYHKFAIYGKDATTAIVSATNVEGDSVNSYGSKAAAEGGKKFVVGVHDEAADLAKFAAYYSNGTAIISSTSAASVGSDKMVEVASYEAATGMGIYGDNFVYAYEDSSSDGQWITYNVNGSTWDGNWYAPVQTENNGSEGTDLSTYNETTIDSVSDFIWHSSTGKIEWKETLDLSDSYIGGDANLDGDIEFGDKFISIDSSIATAFVNKAANITFENVDCNLCDEKNIIYAAGIYSTLSGIQTNGQSCSSVGKCSNFVCNNQGGTGNCTFDVVGFTGYAIGGNANLTINDSAEGSSVNTSTSIDFFAHYINTTSGAHISSASCNVSFDDAPSTWYAMTFNGTGDGSYNYTKTNGFATAAIHLWNVSCAGTGFTNLTANDTVLVISIPGPIPEFGDYAVLLVLVTVIGGFLLLKRRSS